MNEKNEALEEVVVVEKKTGPLTWIKQKVSKIPSAVKYVGAGVVGAAAVTAVAAGITGIRKPRKVEDSPLVIEDFTTDFAAAPVSSDSPDEI